MTKYVNYNIYDSPIMGVEFMMQFDIFLIY
jgi:hypothetical protein